VNANGDGACSPRANPQFGQAATLSSAEVKQRLQIHRSGTDSGYRLAIPDQPRDAIPERRAGRMSHSPPRQAGDVLDRDQDDQGDEDDKQVK